MSTLLRTRRATLASVTGALLVAAASACASYQALPPHQLTAKEAQHPVHVTQRNGTEMTLRAAHVSGDTLYGKANNSASEVAIPFHAIYSMTSREPDTGKTMVLASGVALVVGVAAIALAAQ